MNQSSAHNSAISARAIHQRFIEIATGLSADLAGAIARVGPLEIRSDPTAPLVDHLCRSVAGQQLSVRAAGTIWTRLLAAADRQPLSDFLVEENIPRIRSCGLSGAKTRALCGIARAARDGELDVAALGAMDHSERSLRLTALWGVGQWTADMISIFHFGEQDVWPEGDAAARATLQRLTSRRRKTVRTAARFAPHRSMLALYMWEFLDAVPVEQDGSTDAPA